MAKASRAKLSSKKQAERVRQAIRQARIRNAKRTGMPIIPDAVLRALAAAGLPPEKQAYDLKLRELGA
jgi:hypothetical protein